MHAVRHLFVGAFLVLVGHSVEASEVPKEAREVIAQADKAAQAKNYSALRSLMVSQFTWGFGGDLDADQAIAAWREDKRYLRELHSVLKLGCHKTEPNKVNCPGKGGFAFRAGFVKTTSGWRMEYFVEGD